MITHAFASRCWGFAIALIMGTAAAAETALLAPGRYICATVTTDSHLDAMEVTITRDGDLVTALVDTGEALLVGRLIDRRLFLVRQDISDLGLEIVQVIGTVHDDGAVRGLATRTFDGTVIERGAFTLRRLVESGQP